MCFGFVAKYNQISFKFFSHWGRNILSEFNICQFAFPQTNVDLLGLYGKTNLKEFWLFFPGSFMNLTDISTGTPLPAILDRYMTNMCVTMKANGPMMVSRIKAKICAQRHVRSGGLLGAIHCFRVSVWWLLQEGNILEGSKICQTEGGGWNWS